MSVFAFKLLLHICVWSNTLQANGIQTLRYPARFDSNEWRFGKRQDFLTKSRLFMWKPALIPNQLYPYVQKQAIPLNFNSYGIQSRPFMHQSYVFALPTKINYASYQPMKEIEERRKPGNLHHVSIMNALMPKPYLPTVPTYSHQTTSFKNYRTNNKQLYHQYLNHFGQQNMHNFNKINEQQLQVQQQKQQNQHQLQQTVYHPSSSLALQMNKPTIEYLSIKNQNSKINESENKRYEINTPVSQCGRQNGDDVNNSASDVFYYYCNNRITNYKNPTLPHLILTQPTTTTSTSTSTTTTTTSETPTTKFSHFDFNIFRTERPIFLPTPNASPLRNSFIPITNAATLKNSIADSGNEDISRLKKQYNFRNHQEIMSRHENIKQRQQYTTAAADDNRKLHSFFTIEDAVTRSPEMQVFNDPYQAYRHARRQQTNQQRTTSSTTKIPNSRKSNNKSKFQSFFDDLLDEDDYTTSKAYTHLRKNQTNYQQYASATANIPETTSSVTTKPKIKSFFDDLNDEDDYQIPEAYQNDYSLFNIPQKSELKSKQKFPKHNQIIEHTKKNELINDGEIFMGRPKIKESHFKLFKTISPTTYAPPAATTYKPNGNFMQLFLTTNKTPFFASYSSKTRTFAPTFETELERKSTTEIENSFLNPVSTTTTLPIVTTTERKFDKITLKPPLTLRSSAAFKYPKQKVHKPYKNITSTTTKATTALKKVPKYQRQYKTKKLKQFKHLYTTTTTSTTSTTIPTTIESHTNRVSSIAEELTTKKSVASRVYPTIEVSKAKNLRQQSSLTTEVTKKKVRGRTTTASTIKTNDSSTRLSSARRGSKRANISQSEKETSQVTKSQTTGSNKNLRRLKSSSSTTARPLITRTPAILTSTSANSPTPTQVSMRTSSTTTTTIKSIMRIPNSKSRRRSHSDIKSTIKTSNEISNDRQDLNGRVSLKTTTSTVAGIPPLPIEIYFQKSHNHKI